MTPFEDIDRLLPARVLRMPAGEATFITDEIETKSSVKEAVESLYDHAGNFIGAMSKLGTLECHLTAGWDSRMVLSVAMDTPAAIEYLTYKIPGSNGSVDCQISRLIAQRFALNHREVALANKNVRTVWAMLTQNTAYQRYPLAA